MSYSAAFWKCTDIFFFFFSLQQFGLAAWGASGPYQKVYEKFGITGTSAFNSTIQVILFIASCPDEIVCVFFLDIAAAGKKVVEFYKQRGGEVVSPLVKAIHL